MSRYEGLDPELRRQVRTRDRDRCRWCGATNQGVDLHHIEYRRGVLQDVLENLICLCRVHHGFVHGSRNGAGMTISKQVAQQVLFHLVETPGLTGSAYWRRLKRAWAREGRCEHGDESDTCSDCRLN